MKTNSTPEGGSINNTRLGPLAQLELKRGETYQAKNVAAPKLSATGPMKINRAATQAAAQQRKKIFRSRVLKWSRNAGRRRGLGGLPSTPLDIARMFADAGNKTTRKQRKQKQNLEMDGDQNDQNDIGICIGKVMQVTYA